MRNSLKHKVEHLMMLDQRYRDNDYDLLLKVWEGYGLILNTQQRLAFRDTPPADVIVRRRRELSISYPPSPLVAEKRYRQYKVMIEEFSPQTWLQKLLKRKGI